MTDRHAGYVVALDHNMREDDAEQTIAALRQIRGVAAVTPVVGDVAMLIEGVRRDNLWRDRLIALIQAGPEAKQA